MLKKYVLKNTPYVKYACLYTSLNVCSGHKSHSETLRRSLEEIAALYNWDRPALHSPVKKVEKFVKQKNKKMLFFGRVGLFLKREYKR